jgi:hypothetical protein
MSIHRALAEAAEADVPYTNADDSQDLPHYSKNPKEGFLAGFHM